MFGISSGILLALIIIAGFIIFFATLQKFDLLEPYGLELSGPFLMWKTQRGRKFIDDTAHKRKNFWKNYGNLGLIVVTICMVIILVLVVWSAILASSIPSENAPDPEMVLGIPGINPLIPIWYGIAGLAIAIIIHEFSHGILSRVADIKVKSLGLAFLVVPIGAFVEPDEKEMENLPKIKRDRIYAVGPTTNVLFAIVLVLIFSTLFMGSITPEHDGVIVNGITEDSPLDMSDLEVGEEIIRINGVDIEDTSDFRELEIDPMGDVPITVYDGDQERTISTKAGLVVTSLAEGYPAEEAGLKAGDVLAKMENVTLRNYDEFDDFLETKDADERISITFYRRSDGAFEKKVTNLTLADKYESYQDMYPAQNQEEYKGQGYVGVGVTYMGLRVWDVEILPQLLAHPFADADTPGEYVQSALSYISLPFLQLSPVPENIANLYEVTGFMSVLPTTAFWVTANLLYWVFWLNLMVGLFNALPAVPLDGGFIFKDGVSALIEKFGVKDKKKEKISSGVSYTIALMILFMLMWQLIGPRI